MNVTGNTWTFLAMQKRINKYPCKPLVRKEPVKKDLWILANPTPTSTSTSTSTSTWGTNVEMNSF